jgi:hypothetical protein
LRLFSVYYFEINTRLCSMKLEIEGPPKTFGFEYGVGKNPFVFWKGRTPAYILEG